MKAHEYVARVVWTGNKGDGTATYTSYSREFNVEIAGKHDLTGSADALFRGDAALHNPEDLFLTAISSCHLLTYLALCARHGIRVVTYEDAASATLELDGAGSGKFSAITLHPTVTIDNAEFLELAVQLHDKAHQLCFIANSCAVPIRHQPSVTLAGALS